MHIMMNDTYKRHGGQIRRVLNLVSTSDWTMTSISSLWSLWALLFLTIMFGTEPIKGAENIDD